MGVLYLFACTVPQRTERILTVKATSQKARSERVNFSKILRTVLNADNVFTLLEYDHETYDSVLYSRKT